MSIPPKGRLAARHTRMLLVKAGLDDAEAEKLLERLGQDFVAGRFDHVTARFDLVHEQLQDVKKVQEQLSKSSSDRRSLTIGLISGVASTYLTGAIDRIAAGIGADIASVTTPEQAAQYIIRIEWGGRKLTTESSKSGDPLVRRALQIRDERHRARDSTSALYIDGIGMFLDAQGFHGQAEKQRRLALQITERLRGPNYADTGAALSNLGVCLFAQRRYGESAQYLARSLKIMLDNYGPANISTAAAIYNCYICLRAQGLLKPSLIPHAFTQALPQIRGIADGMMVWKSVMAVLLAAKEVAENLKHLINPTNG